MSGLTGCNGDSVVSVVSGSVGSSGGGGSSVVVSSGGGAGGSGSGGAGGFGLSPGVPKIADI